MSFHVGGVLPCLERTITLTDMVAYAGATWDWHKMHYDFEFAREKQLPAPVVDGQVFGAFLVEQLQDWLGPESFVEQLRFTCKAPVFAGETVRCEGTVTGVPGDRLLVSQSVQVVDGDGAVLRVVVANAGARVLLGRSDGLGRAG